MSNIEFVNRLNDEELREHINECRIREAEEGKRPTPMTYDKASITRHPDRIAVHCSCDLYMMYDTGISSNVPATTSSNISQFSKEILVEKFGMEYISALYDKAVAAAANERDQLMTFLPTKKR